MNGALEASDVSFLISDHDIWTFKDKSLSSRRLSGLSLKKFGQRHLVASFTSVVVRRIKVSVCSYPKNVESKFRIHNSRPFLPVYGSRRPAILRRCAKAIAATS